MHGVLADRAHQGTYESAVAVAAYNQQVRALGLLDKHCGRMTALHQLVQASSADRQLRSGGWQKIRSPTTGHATCCEQRPASPKPALAAAAEITRSGSWSTSSVTSSQRMLAGDLCRFRASPTLSRRSATVLGRETGRGPDTISAAPVKTRGSLALKVVNSDL